MAETHQRPWGELPAGVESVARQAGALGWNGASAISEGVGVETGGSPPLSPSMGAGREQPSRQWWEKWGHLPQEVRGGTGGRAETLRGIPRMFLKLSSGGHSGVRRAPSALEPQILSPLRGHFADSCPKREVVSVQKGEATSTSHLWDSWWRIHAHLQVFTPAPRR